ERECVCVCLCLCVCMKERDRDRERERERKTVSLPDLYKIAQILNVCLPNTHAFSYLIWSVYLSVLCHIFILLYLCACVCVWGGVGGVCVCVIIRCVIISPRLEECSLTDKSCAALSSAVRSTSCSLKHLDLGNNYRIHDAG